MTMAWSTGRAGERQYLRTRQLSWQRTRVQEAYLPADQPRSFKSRCMRNSFIALHRPDVHFASREIFKAMAQQTINADETQKKRLARYNFTAPKRLWCHPRQPVPSKIVALSDASWTGSTTQAVIFLSSSESMFYASVPGCRTLGLAALVLDLAFSMQAELRTDNTAAQGLTSRRRARHVPRIHRSPLWLQQVIASRRMRIETQAG